LRVRFFFENRTAFTAWVVSVVVDLRLSSEQVLETFLDGCLLNADTNFTDGLLLCRDRSELTGSMFVFDVMIFSVLSFSVCDHDLDRISALAYLVGGLSIYQFRRYGLALDRRMMR
jgi:hypothetical protein